MGPGTRRERRPAGRERAALPVGEARGTNASPFEKDGEFRRAGSKVEGRWHHVEDHRALGGGERRVHGADVEPLRGKRPAGPILQERGTWRR